MNKAKVSDIEDMIRAAAFPYESRQWKENSWLKGIAQVWRNPEYVHSIAEDIFFLTRHFPAEQNRRVLDLGCGSGVITLVLANLGYSPVGYEYTGTWVGGPEDADSVKTQVGEYEFALALMRGMHPDLDFALFSDVRDVPFANFDLLTMFAVWEHMESEPLAEFCEALRTAEGPDQIFVAKLPRTFAYQELMARALGLPHHEKRYTRRSFARELASAGFQITSLQPDHLWVNAPVPLASRFYPVARGLEKLTLDKPFAWLMHDFRITAKRVDEYS